MIKGIHAFTIKAQGLANRIITDVQVSKGFNPDNIPNPPPTFHKTKALWDTGATRSVITTETVDALKLQPSGIAEVNHAGGTSKSNTYIVNFILPNSVQAVGAFVTECPAIAGACGAIIGMDIIAGGDLAITNVEQKTWASFRMPSLKAIDYVEETNRMKHAGIGRNDPCPCGKIDPTTRKPVKFKHCCGQAK